MDGIISMANGSSSSLYGNIAYAIKDLVESKFPKGYFNYTSVSSELATRNMRRLFGGPNNSVEMQKRKKPYLIIQPTFSTMENDGPLQNIPLTANFDNLQYRVDKLYLFEAIRDHKYGYNLKFRMNRDRIEFDINVTTSNLHSQLDIYRTMKNQIMWDRSFAYRIALESIIPKPIIGIISKYCGMDLEESEEYIPILLKRLNACSAYPITYKLRNASATDEWFLYYTHNIIVTFSDLTLESGRRKNMVEDEFPITFRVTAEFNLPGVYFIDGNLEKLNSVDITLVTKEYSSENDTYIPIYTLNNLYSRFPYENNGMQLYGSTIFKTETKDNQLEDHIDIKGVLDDNHIRVIRAHRAWNMNPDTLMRIYLLKNGDILEYRKEYYIDWNSMELVVRNPDDEATYRFVMYFNYETVNEILTNTAYLNNYDVNTLKENKVPEGSKENYIVNIGSSIDASIYQPSENIFAKENIPEGKDDSFILEHDPEYCKGCNHEPIDPDLILYKNKVIVNTSDGRYKAPSDSLILKEHATDDDMKDPSKFILEKDPDYCGDLSNGVDISNISIAINPNMTNADIYNKPVIEPDKKFHSSK